MRATQKGGEQVARVPPAAAAAPPMPEKYVFCLLKKWFLFYSLPIAGRIAWPASEVAANKTAPPPMIPKLLTVMTNNTSLQGQNMKRQIDCPHLSFSSK